MFISKAVVFIDLIFFFLYVYFHARDREKNICVSINMAFVVTATLIVIRHKRLADAHLAAATHRPNVERVSKEQLKWLKQRSETILYL